MLINRIKKLIALLEEGGVDEIEVSRWGSRIRIRKHSAAVDPPQGGTIETVSAAPAVEPARPVAREEPSPAEPPEGEERVEATSDFVVKAPMVGTFYRAASPDAEPFVEVGTKVTVGQTLCIIEAMKLMNELPAEVNGVVNRILVENGEPVEYGQELFWIGT
jgi:acetyl-CoA carboxylase biotin carboxyl carrier protein